MRWTCCVLMSASVTEGELPAEPRVERQTRARDGESLPSEWGLRLWRHGALLAFWPNG